MIEERGGFICKKGNNYRLEGDLILSRSFGDYIYKNYITADPDIYEIKIKKEDKYLIIATDGFWKVSFPFYLSI
jgi:serine/threonine protein phosphatase PrpC